MITVKSKLSKNKMREIISWRMSKNQVRIKRAETKRGGRKALDQKAPAAVRSY